MCMAYQRAASKTVRAMGCSGVSRSQVSRLCRSLEVSARATKAFTWGRKVPNPVALLRLVLAYCLGEWGLRSTATRSSAIGLADLSNVALLYQLRQCGGVVRSAGGQVSARAAPCAQVEAG
jgi:hypothetical protein